MKKVSIILSITALAVALLQMFELHADTPGLFTPAMAFAYFVPCGAALIAYRGPNKAWFVWLAWIANLVIALPIVILSVIYFDRLLATFDVISALKAATVLAIAPICNLLALKPWGISSAAVHG